MTGLTIRIPIGQAITGVVNTDETIASINLRASPFSSATYNGTHIGDGVYEFTGVSSGVYKVYSSGSELAKVNWVIVGETGTILASQVSGVLTLANIPTITDAKLGTNINANKIANASVSNTAFQYIANLSSDAQTQFASIITSLVAYVTKAGSDIITGAKQFKDGGNIVVVGATATAGYSTNFTVTDNKHWVCLGQLMQIINDYITGITIPYAQQSDRTIRVIYGGTVETGSQPRVVLTIDNAISAATAETPALAKQFYVFIEKNGVETGFGANAILSTAPDYINYQGENSQMIIFPADNTFICGGLGNTTFRDLQMVWGAGATATPGFTNYIFENVTFDFADNTLDFTGCLFLNCKIKRTSGTWTMTDCYGTPIEADNFPTTTTGFSPKVYIAGAYNQRDLGRKGATIASAATITAGNGNYFEVSGVSAVRHLTITNWTDGSIITIMPTGIFTLVNKFGGNGQFQNKSGADITTVVGLPVQYILDTTIWYEL